MDIGISTACFYPIKTEETFETIKNLGFDRIELFLNTQSEFEALYIKKIKKLLDKLKIKVVSLHSYTAAFEGLMFFSTYNRRTQDSINLYEKYFEICNFLSADYFTFHGEKSMEHSVLNNTEYSKSDIEIYKILCEKAKKHGVLLAQENVAWCRSNNIEYIKLLHNFVPELKFTLDIKQARRSGKDIYDYIKAMDNALVNIHVNDFDDSNTCLLPGEGNFNFNLFLNKLNNINYLGDLIIEVYADNYKSNKQLTDSKNYLNNIYVQNVKFDSRKM